MVDITHRKQAEAEKQLLEGRLRQSQKMEALGTLAGGIAHDFNNILTAIIGYAELLKQDCDTDARRQQRLNGILQGAFRARDLVRQILAFSCAQITQRRPLRLSDVLSEALRLLRAALPSTIGIQFTQAESAGHVLADISQLHQVIMNLGSNAAQAMPHQRGTIKVALREVELTRERALLLGVAAGSYLCFSVADDGQGIDPKALNRIFEPFFTTKPFGQGTGLGLSVVHGILQGHGGTITVDSQVGRGTAFQIYLPQIPAPEQVSPLPAAVFLPGNNESILLVDEEPHVVTVLEEGLKRLGYRVTPLESSGEAWDIFNQRPHDFDLVITDQTMPGITGLQLITQMRLLNSDVPAILCTGYPPGVTKEELRQIGRCHLVSKPVELVELSQIIRRVLVRASLTPEHQAWETAMLGAVA
jgi:nitrogen-specific signal transduction histidine kinase/ActR/RegA family two-component response regulator